MTTMKQNANNKKRSAVKGHWLWGVLVFAILLLVDLLTKVIAEVYFEIQGHEDIVLIPGVIELTCVYNPGVAFSVGAEANPAVKMGIVIGTALIMLGASVMYFKMDKRRAFIRWCLVLVVAGGVGNLIDRILYRMWAVDGGGVRDMVFLDFSTLLEEWFHLAPTNFLYFGVCNFADFWIVGGAVALILGLLFFDTDAFFPVGKYKELAKEAMEKEAAKQAAKQAANAAETQESQEPEETQGR